MSINNVIYLDTYCLYSKKFVGVKTHFTNTLAQSIYGTDVLVGNEESTNLFKLDCQIFYEYLESQWKEDLNAMWQDIKDRLPSLSKRKKLNPYYHKAEIFEAHVIRELERFQRKTKFAVVFATSSRKSKQLFGYKNPQEWTGYLGSKAISHGNNLMSNNQGIAQRLNLNTLIVDDDDKDSMERYGLADCHGAIKHDIAFALGSKLTRNPFQFRAFSYTNNAIFKGVLRPVNKVFAAYKDMGDYDMIIPMSCFKYDKAIGDVEPGAVEMDATLIVHKSAKASWSSLGLTLQYFKTPEAVEELKSIALANLQSLNAYVKNGKLDVKAILNMMDKFDEADCLDDEELEIVTTYQNVSRIIRADNIGLLHNHPYVVQHVIKWYASQLKSIAITAGIRQRYLLACPLNELEDIAHTIIVNDNKLSDTKGLLVRFPARNSNDVQPINIVNLATVWQEFDAWVLDNPEADVNTRKQYLVRILNIYLELLGFDSTQVSILSSAIRKYGLHRFTDCFWVSPSLWATYGGDFDGDYGNIIERSVMPACYEEASNWERYDEAQKPDKKPMTGSLIEQAVKSFSNEIGLLSNFATIMNTTMEESEYRIQAPLIAQQMQVAVDAYKTMTQVDQSLKSKWLEYYKEYSSGHWVRCYKQCDFYTKPDALLPASNDTIGQLIAVVNEYFVALDIKPAPLESFKDLLPIDPKHYHYHKPEWGQAIDENGKPLVYGDGSPVKCTLYHRMGQFYAEYASKLKDLCIYYKDGSIANYYEEDGELVYLSDERKAQIRSDRRTIIDEYKSKWDEWMAQSPANVRPILAAALWNVAHSRTSTGAASLCFYLLSNEIVRNLSCPRTVSMKLVTGEPEFLGGNIPSDRLYQLHIGNQLDEFNNPRPVAMDGVNVGKIYPAPAKSSNSGNIKMNFSRLVIEGSVMASLRFIKDYLSKGSISMAEYEVVVILDSINAPVESAELAG